jgi:hypothetical protein
MMPTAELLVAETTRSAPGPCPKQLSTKRSRRKRESGQTTEVDAQSGVGSFHSWIPRIKASSPAALQTLAKMPRSPTAEEYCKYGISAAGLRHFYNTHGHASTGLTTSDLCHSVIKLLTVPAGWECLPTLTDAANRWYSHEYRERATGCTQATPPAGTRSMCEVMAADPVTAHFVGKPNSFVSHAWLYLFDDAVAALEAFNAARGMGDCPCCTSTLQLSGSEDVFYLECSFCRWHSKTIDLVSDNPEALSRLPSPERFYWFDAFSIDEHATQSMPQTWWGTTFRCPRKHAMRSCPYG